MHLSFISNCSSCHTEGEAKGRNGILQTLKCPKCLTELSGQEARQFQEEAERFYREGLQEREKFRSKGLPFPDEVKVFSLPFKGELDRGFYAVYGYLLEH